LRVRLDAGIDPFLHPANVMISGQLHAGDSLTTIEHEVLATLELAIAQRIGEPRYQLWFARRTRFRHDDDRLTVGVPNLHFQEWLQKTFGSEVESAAAEVFGGPTPVRFVIDPELFQTARQEQAAVPPVPSLPVEESATSAPTPRAPSGRSSRKKKAPEGPTLFDGIAPSAVPDPRAERGSRRWHKLSEFFVGASNRVAHASALSVVEEPGQCANPLVLHGPVGTGKTHLLEGTYAGLRRSWPAWRVVFVTAEDFTNRFVQAMRFGKLSTFRKHFRGCDALLVDDLHFLAGKKATQEEFLHTFDALVAEGKQLVLTCDCHPRLAEELSPELGDRLLGGAVWGLLPPDCATRLGILQMKAAALPTAVADEVLKLLANSLCGNVRELEGALNSLRHFARVTTRPIDLGLAREALGDLLRHSVRLVQLADIDRAVCRTLKLDEGALQGKGRAWSVSHPRMLAMYLARRHTSAAHSEIGRHFGGRNHSTVVAAEKKVREWLDKDGELALGERRLRVREVVERIERELR
jgi:chromosomal replication initiator protein